ncbi:MAG TPA: TOMM precursor leader peptide-binding protein [Solirubrobacterales bacterium]
MKKPRIKQTTEQITAPGGDLYLMRPSAGADICIQSPSSDERRLVGALNGTRTVEDLEREFGQEAVADALAQLGELDLLEDAADDDLISAAAMARFDRQLRYFADVSPGPTPSQCQNTLEDARIAVLGVGGLGGWAALSLACIGIGEMLLVDFDLVELSNLNRQVLYGESDVGRPKVEAAARRLQDFSSRLRLTALEKRLESEEEIAELIDGYDFVIDAVDWPSHEIERWVNSACFGTGIPYIAMSHFPPVARVGPLYVPEETGCFLCQEAAYRRDYPLFDTAIEQLRGKESPAATLGPGAGLVGNLVALEILHHLTGLAKPATLGTAVTVDLRTLTVEREAVPREPGCAVCGELELAAR